MEIVALEPGVVYTCWNDSSVKMAAGTEDGSILIYEPDKGSRSLYSRSSKWKAHQGVVLKLVWAPSEYGDVLACCSTDGVISVWEEVEEREKPLEWRLCRQFTGNGVPVLDVQFGSCATGLKLVAAGGDGYLRVYEASNVLELDNWQLQAEFSNVTDVQQKLEKIVCSAASISWRPAANAIQQPLFVTGFRTNSRQHGIVKVWEFGEMHQRWHLVAELISPDFEYGLINHVAWASNIGRPYELIAIASSTSLSIWSVQSSATSGGSPSVKLLGSFTEHEGEVWQVEWDMAGMTLASTGADGVVRFWQSNYKGTWEQKGILEGSAN
ncbi:unnamed protein product [Calypogeia fissa]